MAIRLVSICAAAALLLPGCAPIKGIFLQNDTGSDLTPYPVVTNPPPPHREADPGSKVPAGGEGKIDPQSFNALYYAPGFTPPGPNPEDVANALNVQLPSDDDDPKFILARTFHYFAEPGQEGTQPDLQPKKLHEIFHEVNSEHVKITLSNDDTVPGGWKVEIVDK